MSKIHVQIGHMVHMFPQPTTCMAIVYYCENVHLLRHRCEHTCTLAIYYQVDLVMKTVHCKAKYAFNLKPDPKLLDTGDIIMLCSLPQPLTLVCA